LLESMQLCETMAERIPSKIEGGHGPALVDVSSAWCGYKATERDRSAGKL
jgi:hypothetical protein